MTLKTTRSQNELAQHIVDLCRAEGWQEGHRLTERALAEKFNVSRSPIRFALELLVNRGVVSRTDNGRYELAASSDELDRLPVEIPPTEVELLHERILRDRFAERIPSIVTEADLLRRYSTTRGLLQKALMRLSHEGMVDRGQGHGWIFREILNTVEAHRASYQFRLAVEPAAIRAPNFKIDFGRVERMLAIHRRLQADEVSDLTGSKQFDLDAELHETIASFSGNEFFLEAVQRQNQLRRVAEYETFYASDRMQDSHDGHIKILEALLEGDTELAALLMTQHLYLSCRITGIFRRNGKGQPAIEDA